MAKRFTSTEIWEEDWFLEMPNEYKLFWYYMLSSCDYAGFFKVNLRSFSSLLEVNLTATKALSYFNNGKQRVREISGSVWFIEDFFVFQYGEGLNRKNPMHRGVEALCNKNGVLLSSIRGLKDHTNTPKDKDKEIHNKNGVPEKNGHENQNHFEQMLMQDMMAVWKKYNPTYQDVDEEDFPSLLQLAKKIGKKNGWNDYTVVVEKNKEVVCEWEKIVQFIRKDPFYKKLNLPKIEKQWSSVHQAMIAAAEDIKQTPERVKLKLK